MIPALDKLELLNSLYSSGEMPVGEQKEEEDGLPWSVKEMIREQRHGPLDAPEISRKKVGLKLEVVFFMDLVLLYKPIQPQNSIGEV